MRSIEKSKIYLAPNSPPVYRRLWTTWSWQWTNATGIPWLLAGGYEPMLDHDSACASKEVVIARLETFSLFRACVPRAGIMCLQQRKHVIAHDADDLSPEVRLSLRKVLSRAGRRPRKHSCPQRDPFRTRRLWRRRMLSVSFVDIAAGRLGISLLKYVDPKPANKRHATALIMRTRVIPGTGGRAQTNECRDGRKPQCLHSNPLALSVTAMTPAQRREHAHHRRRP